MLPVSSKYKIAKRLGAGVFEQTQSQKFALSDARFKKAKRGRAPSDYGRQLLEKQRIRFTYGLRERVLANYAKKAYEAGNPAEALHRALEMRLDSVVYRAGLAPTRRAARQMVSHGHIMVGGKRSRVASAALKKGDTITVREGSASSTLFARLTDPASEAEAPSIPSWLKREKGALSATVDGEPSYNRGETALDYAALFEFYSR
jgi:small subunit ribosomal protein S4